MFGAAVVIAIAFFGFMLMGNGAQGISSHPIDENALPTYEPPQGGAGSAAPGPGAAGGAAGAAQEVSLTASGSGYDKSEIRVKAGVPVHFTFTANNAGCCAQLLIDKVGVQLISRNGQAVDATFTPMAPSNYPYHCGMNMCRGVLVAE
jgi:plastocyanin